MGTRRHRIEEFKRYQKYKENYIRAFQRMLEKHPSKRGWRTGEEVFEWWLWAEAGVPTREQESISEVSAPASSTP